MNHHEVQPTVFTRITHAVRQSMRPPSAKQLAQRELEEAERRLLEAQSAAEYASRMVDYHRSRITRLRSHLLHSN